MKEKILHSAMLLVAVALSFAIGHKYTADLLKLRYQKQEILAFDKRLKSELILAQKTFKRFHQANRACDSVHAEYFAELKSLREYGSHEAFKVYQWHDSIYYDMKYNTPPQAGLDSAFQEVLKAHPEFSDALSRCNSTIDAYNLWLEEKGDFPVRAADAAFSSYYEQVYIPFRISFSIGVGDSIYIGQEFPADTSDESWEAFADTMTKALISELLAGASVQIVEPESEDSGNQSWEAIADSSAKEHFTKLLSDFDSLAQQLFYAELAFRKAKWIMDSSDNPVINAHREAKLSYEKALNDWQNVLDSLNRERRDAHDRWRGMLDHRDSLTAVRDQKIAILDSTFKATEQDRDTYVQELRISGLIQTAHDLQEAISQAFGGANPVALEPVVIFEHVWE